MFSFFHRHFYNFHKQIGRPIFLKSVPEKFFCEDGGSSTTMFKTFNDMLLFRRLQAEKSVLIGVNSDTHIEEVLKICERFGAPTRKIVFRPGKISEYQLVCLVEYRSVKEVQQLLDNCQHVVGNGYVPVFSRLLSHHSTRSKGSLHQLQLPGHVEYKARPTEEELAKQMSSCPNASEQVELLFQQERLPDLSSRLRFLLCTQVEDSLRGFLPHCKVLPFGSSVNGFGNYNCDLDVSLDFSQSLDSSRQGLAFQCPSRQMANDRSRSQVTLEVLSDIIQNFFPCVSSVQRILRARVPILKIHHTITGLDCDISVANDTGMYMSELLFLMGELDPRVRPLVFAVRRWARAAQLTRETSGNWITNFSLTLMLVFFLQTRTPPVLPTVQHLKDSAGPEDVRTASGVDCTFKRTFTEISKSENTESLGSLLASFFYFCADTKWEEHAISLVTGKTLKKPDTHPLFIQNPLETHLNVCKIVTSREVEKFLSAVKDVLWELESNPDGSGLFKFLVLKGGPSGRSKLHKSLIVSQLFKQSGSSKSPGPAQRSAPVEMANSKSNEKPEKYNVALSNELNAEFLKLQLSRHSQKKPGTKSGQKCSKTFSSSDLWKLL